MATTVIDRPHVLHTAKDYDAAVAELRELLERNPKKRTREFESLELLSLLVEHYETRKVPEPPVPAPTAVVEFMLKQRGMTRAKLTDALGGKSRVSEFFAGKRALSTNQIKALRDLLGVPADLLLPRDDADQATPRQASVVSMAYKSPAARKMRVAERVAKKK